VPNAVLIAIDRRSFLRTATTSVVALAGGAVACGRNDDSYSPAALAQPELLIALGGATVRELGRRYRQSVEAENDPAVLRKAILATRRWSARLGLPRVSIADHIRSEFADGHTVIVDGWLLSRTEARQCALYSVVHPV
jgi:hypothetical protein